MSARDDLSTEQRQAMTGALARIAPATGEQVRQALSDARSVAGHNSQPLIHERLMRVEARVPAIVRRLLDTEAEVDRLRALEKTVMEFVAARAEYITAIRNCYDSADYNRWQGHAESRRQLAQTLGLPVAWPETVEGGEGQ